MKTAYLTIDDAPSVDLRQKVDFLAEKQIPAVWFGVGEAIARRPDAAVYALQRGGILGNHTYTHPHCSALEPDAVYDEIRRTETLIDDVYRRAGVVRPAKYFRFPYGDQGTPERKEALQAFLRAEGFTPPAREGITYAYWSDDVDWRWTYDCMDWSIYSAQPQHGVTSVEAVFARMEEHVPEGMRGLNTPGSEEIILTHDHAETTRHFEAIIQRLLDKGITFKAVR